MKSRFGSQVLGCSLLLALARPPVVPAQAWLAGVPSRTQDLGPVVAWELSGRFPPKPAAMPFTAAPHRLDFAVSGDELWLAFSIEEGICVERAVLPAGAGE